MISPTPTASNHHCILGLGCLGFAIACAIDSLLDSTSHCPVMRSKAGNNVERVFYEMVLYETYVFILRIMAMVSSDLQ